MGLRLVMIEWVDSFGCSSNWQDMVEPFPEPQPMICRSVGWLAHDGNECKVLVPHVAESEAADSRQGCGDMTIPNVAIRKLVDLTERGTAKRATAPRRR